MSNEVQQAGVDTTLLQQRRAFLRPDSMLAIVIIADTHNSSLKQFSQYPGYLEAGEPLPAARQTATEGPGRPLLRLLW